MHRLTLLVALPLALAAACAHVARPTPAATAAQTVTGPTVAAQVPTVAPPVEPARDRYRPRHQGGAHLSSGIYVREDDDLVVDTPLRMVLRRTYNSFDHHTRQFGVNATHSGEWWLHGDRNPRVPWADLILDSGSRIHFTRVDGGERWQDAVLRHDASSTEFGGALLRWTGTRWEVTLRDGSLLAFTPCGDGETGCQLIERRDPNGHHIDYIRNDSGTLLRMESEGQQIRFEYDDRKRVARAVTSQGRSVSYTYDEHDRLVQASGPNGSVWTYEYDDRNNLTAVLEPRRIIRNEYDRDGRWTGQIVKFSEDDDDPYVARAQYTVENGKVVQSRFDEGDGVRVRRYDQAGYTVSELRDSEGVHPVSIAYDLDPVTHTANGAVVACGTPSRPILRRLDARTARDNQLTDSAIAGMCPAR